MVKLKDIVYRPASPPKENTEYGVGLVLTPGPNDGLYVKLIVEDVSVALPMRQQPDGAGHRRGRTRGRVFCGVTGGWQSPPRALVPSRACARPVVCAQASSVRCVGAVPVRVPPRPGLRACCCLHAAAVMSLAMYPCIVFVCALIPAYAHAPAH